MRTATGAGCSGGVCGQEVGGVPWREDEEVQGVGRDPGSTPGSGVNARECGREEEALVVLRVLNTEGGCNTESLTVLHPGTGASTCQGTHSFDQSALARPSQIGFGSCHRAQEPLGPVRVCSPTLLGGLWSNFVSAVDRSDDVKSGSGWYRMGSGGVRRARRVGGTRGRRGTSEGSPSRTSRNRGRSRPVWSVPWSLHVESGSGRDRHGETRGEWGPVVQSRVRTESEAS